MIYKSHDQFEETRVFLDGSERRHTALRTALIGYGIYQPGWRWSVHAGAQTGQPSANHVGFIVSGQMTIRDATGKETDIGPGCAFEVGPGHDAWVVGEEPCVALDFAPTAADPRRGKQ